MRRRTPGLHVESFGIGRPLVMVHGWAMHSGLWRDFAASLAERARVSLIDLPGHGKSGPLADFSLPAVAAALAEAAPPHATWLGWSLGALFALEVARQQPERVAGLVLVAGSPRFVAGEDWPGVAASALERVAAEMETHYAATLRRFIGLQTFGLERARTLTRHLTGQLAARDPPDPRALRGGLAVLQQADLRDTLRHWSGPSLALLGAHDRLVPPSVAPALKRLAPRVETRVLAGAAHLPFATHPRETAQAIAEFLCHHAR